MKIVHLSKICSKCKKRKTLESFRKNKSAKDGRVQQCCLCLSRNKKRCALNHSFGGRGYKYCGDCKKYKKFDEFRKIAKDEARRYRYGVSCMCKQCHAKRQAKYRKKNP